MKRSGEHITWGHFNMELAKLYEICETYEKLIGLVDIKNNRYNAAFQLFMDSMTSYMHIALAKFFDPRGDSWSLYKYSQIDRVRIDDLKSQYADIIDARHTIYAHWSKKLTHSNYRFLSSAGVTRVRQLLGELEKILREINIKYGYDESYAMSWIGLQDSVENMLEDLKKYDHMKVFDNLINHESDK